MENSARISALSIGLCLALACAPPNEATPIEDAASTDSATDPPNDGGSQVADASFPDTSSDANGTDLARDDTGMVDTGAVDAGVGADVNAGTDGGGSDGASGCTGLNCGANGHCEEQDSGAVCLCDPGYIDGTQGCEICDRPLPDDVEPDTTAGLPFGYLDVPGLEANVSGRVLFRGWVLAAQGVQSIDLFIDGEHFRTLEQNTDRPDVCAALPALPCEPGFSKEIDLFDLTECDHLAELWATDTAGNTALIDNALLHVTRPPKGYRLGERELVHHISDTRITQALDMIVDDADHVIACFGSWHTPGNNYDSHCRDLMSGAEERGHGSHETVGVGLDKGSAGVLIGFEADDARQHGGPGIFGTGLVHDDGGTHFWQSVSVGHGFAIAAAARIEGLHADVYIGEADGAGPWSLLATRGFGVPHRQLFLDPHHLIFTTRYQDAGTPRMIRVDGQRQITVVTYSGLPAGCEGVGTAALIPNVGLVAGTYSDQLPWRGGSCGAVGLLDADTGAGSDWVSLAAADIIDIIPIGDQGYFAVAVNFPSRVVLMSPELEVTDTLPLVGPQVGGLAYLDGVLYAASAGPGIGARVFTFPLLFNDQGPAPVEPPPPNDDREFCLVWQQTVQSCASCGIWFDWEGQQSNKARLVVDYTVGGQQQSRTYQHGNPSAGSARSVTISPNSSTMQHAMLIKQASSHRGLFQADISDIDPAAVIDQATLYLHIESSEGLANSDNTSVIQAHECLTSWDGDHVSWTQATADQTWSNGGGDIGPLVRAFSAGADMHDRGFNKINNNINFDFTDHARDLMTR